MTTLKRYLVTEHPWMPYVIPFILFLLITGLSNYFTSCQDIAYIVKILIVSALLWSWSKEYARDITPSLNLKEYLLATISGLVVLLLWLVPESVFPYIGEPAGFNPFSFGWPEKIVPVLIIIRLAGAVLVVPVMEELFWRSFLLRYAVNTDFRTVPLGTFTWYSFSVGAILFGLEHHQIVQGVLAGVVYSYLVIRQKSLKGCILAHAVTNLGLGIYVLWSGNWTLW